MLSFLSFHHQIPLEGINHHWNRIMKAPVTWNTVSVDKDTASHLRKRGYHRFSLIAGSIRSLVLMNVPEDVAYNVLQLCTELKLLHIVCGTASLSGHALEGLVAPKTLVAFCLQHEPETKNSRSVALSTEIISKYLASAVNLHRLVLWCAICISPQVLLGSLRPMLNLEVLAINCAHLYGEKEIMVLISSLPNLRKLCMMRCRLLGDNINEKLRLFAGSLEIQLDQWQWQSNRE